MPEQNKYRKPNIFLLKHFLRISHVATALNAKSHALKYPSPYDATRDKNVTK